MGNGTKLIYLDNAATAPMCPKTAEKMAVFLDKQFFNPSAAYAGGVRGAMDSARAVVLGKLGGNGQLIFTASATEANNYALSAGHKDKRGGIVISAGEHPSVYNTATGAAVCGLKTDGTVDEEKLYSMVNGASLVSVFHVNNITGAVNDIFKIARRVKEINPTVVFHADGVQAFCKYDYKLNNDIDLYSISAHKIGGPKGVGALYVKKGVNLRPWLYGGNQEGGLRAGTENIAGIVGFAAAVENFVKVVNLRECFLSNLTVPYVVNGQSDWILSLSFEGHRGEIIQRQLAEHGIYIGVGAACSPKIGANKTLLAMGLSKALIEGSVRISFGTQNTTDEVERAAEILVEILNM